MKFSQILESINSPWALGAVSGDGAVTILGFRNKRDFDIFMQKTGWDHGMHIWSEGPLVEVVKFRLRNEMASQQTVQDVVNDVLASHTVDPEMIDHMKTFTGSTDESLKYVRNILKREGGHYKF